MYVCVYVSIQVSHYIYATNKKGGRAKRKDQEAEEEGSESCVS